MKITIDRNLHLMEGEQIYDKEEIIETTKQISISIIRKYDFKGDHKDVIYLQIGNFLDKDFKEYEVTTKDMIFIK